MTRRPARGITVEARCNRTQVLAQPGHRDQRNTWRSKGRHVVCFGNHRNCTRSLGLRGELQAVPATAGQRDERIASMQLARIQTEAIDHQTRMRARVGKAGQQGVEAHRRAHCGTASW
jgi:hypothetical protein